MANTGYLAPVSAFTVSGGFGGDRPWVSAGSTGSLFSAARLSDDVRVMIDDISAAVIPFPFFTQFSAAIPAGSEVQGFSVRYERRRNSTAASANETWMMLTSGAGAGVQRLGTTANSNTGNWTTTDTYVTAGGSGSMFGMTTADASAGRVNSRFGVAINIRYGTGTTLTSAIAQIDNVQLQIHYTPPTVSAEPYSAEFDRENFSVGIVRNLVGQSSEYGSEVATGAFSLNTTPGTAEYGFELQPIDIIPIGVQTAEFDYSADLVALPQGAVDAEVFTVEFDHESASAGIVLNTVVQSAEFDREASTVNLTLNAGVQSAEFDRENTLAALALNLEPQDQEQDYEFASVALTQLHALGVESLETDYESESVSLAASSIPQSAEFGNEITSTSLVLEIVVQGVEVDHEVGSVAISGPALAIDNGEWDYESQNAGLSNNVFVDRSEFDQEFGSPGLSNEMLVSNPEFEHESGDVSLALDSRSKTYEWDWESSIPGLTVAHQIAPDSSEYSREFTELNTVHPYEHYWFRKLESLTRKRELSRRRLWA